MTDTTVTDAKQNDVALRESLIDAAMRCIKSNGLAKTSMEDVAAEAGVELEVLTSVFENKSILVVAVQEVMLDQMKSEYIADMPEGSVRDIIKFILRTRCDFAESHVEQTKMFFHSALKDMMPWSKALDKIIWLLSIEFVSLIERGVREGEFRQGIDVNIVARSLMSFYLTGLVTVGLRAETFDANVVWAFVEPQIDMLLDSQEP